MELYQKLRERYPRFLYRGYKIEEEENHLKLTYDFEIEGLSSFAPVWRFPLGKTGSFCLKEDRVFRDMIFSLGMVELVSYWKITCSPFVAVEAGVLDEARIKWWKDLYFNGLGEFFYVNHIESVTPENLMEITATGSEYKKAMDNPEAVNSCSEPRLDCAADIGTDFRPDSLPDGGILVPVGGGKDSAVTLELMKKAGESIYAYIINPRGATIHTTEAAGLDGDHVIRAGRTLDVNMLELNRQGYLNGHTPFSALVAFSSVIAARLYGLSHIALSNESSANESTVQGSTVNHQYSKSFKFEEDFHWYAGTYLPGSACYFSLLRPLSEYQIARFFAMQKQYHGIFRSCNAGSKTDSWCGHCPKCLFVYLILSPFLTPAELEGIFGTNMLEDATMKVTLEQLVGIHEEKPFECVGSRDEINTAIVQTIKQMEEQGEKLPGLLSYYKTTGLYEKNKDIPNNFSSYYDEENLVPERFAELVKASCVDA